jgi:proto-oncogene tyrosine-protein kinase ROS
LQKVISLATANKKFYWTNGDSIFYEEDHNNDYFHNSIPDLHARSYKKLLVNLQSSQPIPSPVNPPTNVQAIFGKNIAKTTWQAPHLLGIQGKGAWQNWSYEIAIKEVGSQRFISHKTTNTTSYKISGLRENTEYVIKAAAYTDSGKGPWSSEFRGNTLSRSEHPAIYWSAAKGLLKSDAAGENVETLIHKSRMKNFYFIDMTWYKEQIYLVTNDSHVYWYNTKTHNQGQLIDIDSVGSIAVDWIGMKLYWSNPKRQMVRSLLDLARFFFSLVVLDYPRELERYPTGTSPDIDPRQRTEHRLGEGFFVLVHGLCREMRPPKWRERV